RLSLVVLTLFIAASTSFGQSKEALKQYNKGKDFYDVDEFENALPFFEKAANLAPTEPDLNYYAGVTLQKLHHEIRSLPYLQAAKQYGSEEKDLLYLLGIAYHYAHKFDEAIAAFNEYKAKTKRIAPEVDDEIRRRIAECNSGKELVKKPVEVVIKNLGGVVNSKFADYVPAVSADEQVLIFTSRRDNSTGGKTDETGQYFEDIYMSTKVNDSTWGAPVQLPNNINTPAHDACVGLSPDGMELFIYKDENSGDLFYSSLEGKVWSNPKSLGNNINSSSWEPSASTNATENLIFFTSNRKGGYGNRDIYVTRKQANGEFGPAVNLGPKINTEYDEDSPFIHADGKTLYFSSKGHKSMGGFDIFYCTINPETGEILTDPINMGFPINTADDEVFFVWTADGKRAYFSSERVGGYGEKDLYVLTRKESDAALVVLKGKITACDTKAPLAANITVTDLSTQKPIGVYTSNSSTGKYTVILPAGKNYGIAVEANGYLFYSKNIDIPKLNTFKEIQDAICLEKIKVGKKIVLRNVFFDYNKATLRPESEEELARLVEILHENKTIHIQIGGHTDSDGNDDYNMKLSDARAKSVVDYLIAKGIDTGRLTY
ncbi:MAG: OmpA family protein, partial [Cytophagales bacterium]|nr:OmpA family protein [Cytophagales bacterium]